MEWLTNIGISAAGMPWWAVFILLMVIGAAREIIPKLLLWRGANLAERQYEDSEARLAREALVEGMQSQINELRAGVAATLSELREVRLQHGKCEIEQERLRGVVNVMQLQIDRLMSHDTANKEQLKAWTDATKTAVRKIDPEAAAELP